MRLSPTSGVNAGRAGALTATALISAQLSRSAMVTGTKGGRTRDFWRARSSVPMSRVTIRASSASTASTSPASSRNQRVMR